MPWMLVGINCAPPTEVVGDTDAEWNWLSSLLENALTTAKITVDGLAPASLRRKGAALSFVAASDERVATCRVGRYVERTYRKLLGRLREVQRQRRRGRSSAPLLRKITLAWPSDIPWQGCRGQTSDYVAPGGNFSTAPVILNPAGLPTSGPEEGLRESKNFWQEIWMRDAASAREQELKDMLDAGIVRRRLSSDNWLPAALVLQAKAKHMAGTAPGLDGWDAKELALLPEDAFELFRTLAFEWGARQQWPSVWQNIRQVSMATFLDDRVLVANSVKTILQARLEQQTGFDREPPQNGSFCPVTLPSSPVDRGPRGPTGGSNGFVHFVVNESLGPGNVLAKGAALATGSS
eukprot:s2439_g7.t1